MLARYLANVENEDEIEGQNYVNVQDPFTSPTLTYKRTYTHTQINVIAIKIPKLIFIGN